MNNQRRIIRVFPRRTNATPTDDLVRINVTPSFFDEADEVHISVAFTWDIARAEWLAKQWQSVAQVKVGGPAYNERGGNFTAGMYLKNGYVITSRGCPNRCWFCAVPKREGRELRELPVVDGWIVTDDNLLACSQAHIDKVFEMLKRQPHRAQFVGGLEAKLLTPEMAQKLYDLHPKTMYFAYDTPDDYEPLVQAGRYLAEAGYEKREHIAQCYVLVGYKGDTFDAAQKRLYAAWDAGFFPMAMLYRDYAGTHNTEWFNFQREWADKRIVGYKLKQWTMDNGQWTIMNNRLIQIVTYLTEEYKHYTIVPAYVTRYEIIREYINLYDDMSPDDIYDALDNLVAEGRLRIHNTFNSVAYELQ
jgi:hypothetical protein